MTGNCRTLQLHSSHNFYVYMKFSHPVLSLLYNIFLVISVFHSQCKQILYKLSHKPDTIPGLGRLHTEGNKEYFYLKCYVQKFQLHLLDSV